MAQRNSTDHALCTKPDHQPRPSITSTSLIFDSPGIPPNCLLNWRLYTKANTQFLLGETDFPNNELFTFTLISGTSSMFVSITADTSVAFVRESHLTQIVLSRTRISVHFTNILNESQFFLTLCFGDFILILLLLLLLFHCH